MGNEKDQGIENARDHEKLSESERNKLQVQREALVSTPSPSREQGTSGENTPKGKMPAIQRDEKDLSRASTAGKDKLRPVRGSLFKAPSAASTGSSSLSETNSVSIGDVNQKDVLRTPSASQSQTLERPSTSPSIKSVALQNTSKESVGRSGKVPAEWRTEAKRTAKNAVAREKQRAFDRKMQHDTSTRAMLFLQSLKHAPGIKLSAAVKELKGSVVSKHNTLFGALNANLHELQHALMTASDESTVRDIDAVEAIHLERRRAIYHTKSAMASPTASREFSASFLPRPPPLSRPTTSPESARPGRTRSQSDVVVTVDRSASSEELSASQQPQPEDSSPSVPAVQTSKSAVRFASTTSVRSLPPPRAFGSRRRFASIEELPPSFIGDLPGLPGTAPVNESLLTPAWPQAARIRQLNTEALIVKVSIARIRGLLPPCDCMSFPPMALVVSLDEDTRVVPLKVFFHSAFAHSCTVWQEPIDFEFVFDGVLSECPLYVGVHRLADSGAQFAPDGSKVACHDWKKMIGTAHSADGEHVMAGNETFMGGLKAKLELLPRNTTLRTTLMMSSSVPSTRLKRHFLAGEDARRRGDKNYQNFSSAYEILERQRASKPLEHVFASQGIEKEVSPTERRQSENSDKPPTNPPTPKTPSKPKRPANTNAKRFVRIQNTAQFMRLASNENRPKRLPFNDEPASERDDAEGGFQNGDRNSDEDAAGADANWEAVSLPGEEGSASPAVMRRRASRLLRGSTFVDDDEPWVHGGPSVLEKNMHRQTVNTVYVSLYRMYTEHEEHAALVLQRVVRGHKGRAHTRQHRVQVGQLREEALRLGLDNEEQLKAARTIQVIIRFFWKSRTKKTKTIQPESSPVAAMASGPLLSKKAKSPTSKDEGQGVIDLDVQLVNIEANHTPLTSNLSYLQQAPTFGIPCCGLRVSPQGVQASSSQTVSFLKHVFPCATTIATTGKASKGDTRHRMEEIDRVAKSYTKSQSASPKSGQYDPSTCTWVWEQVRPEQHEDEHLRPRSAANSQRVYRVRRYDLMKYDQRMLLRNEIASHVRVMSYCPESHFEVLRNAYLESTPKGPYAITVVDQDLGDVSLEVAVRHAGAVPEPVLSVLLRDLLLVVQQLHGVCGCIHNDLDLRNVYISRLTGEMKLGGFQYAQFPSQQPGSQLDNRTEDDGEVDARRFIGPLRHQAPERMLGLECGVASDIWSLGVIARTLVTGRFPWEAEDPTSLGFKTQVVEGTLRPLLVNPVEEMVLSAAFGEHSRARAGHENAVALRRLHQASEINDWMQRATIGERTPAPRYYSRELSDLVAAAMDKSPHKRPSTKALLAHRFFRRFRPDIQELKQWLKKHRVTLSAGDSSLLFLEDNSMFKRVNSAHFISPARADALQGALARSILGSLV